MSVNNELVAQHYNAIPDQGLKSRGESKIIQMKNFNNWVKSVLIRTYCRPGYYVLDICGGKGGDLPKWNKGNIGGLVLADVALVSVQHAVDRYNERRNNFHATFISADCCAVSITDYLPDLDFVSCQFSLHYSFETEERARILLQNITGKLKPGGYFVGTIPDANYIVKRIRSSNSPKFGNGVFSIEFEQNTDFPLFGCKYKFFLEDAIYSLPEYLVHFPTFVKLAKEYGLELILKERFHDFYERNIREQENKRLFHNMNCVNSEGTISPDEWEASGIYLTFAFQKKGADHPIASSQPPPRPTHVRVEDIILLEQ